MDSALPGATRNGGSLLDRYCLTEITLRFLDRGTIDAIALTNPRGKSVVKGGMRVRVAALWCAVTDLRRVP